MATTTERLARFETAQELLGFLFADSSTRLRDESRKEPVDVEALAALDAERKELSALADSLTYENPEHIEQIIATYGPKVRELFAKDKKVAAAAN